MTSVQYPVPPAIVFQMRILRRVQRVQSPVQEIILIRRVIRQVPVVQGVVNMVHVLHHVMQNRVNPGII